MKLDNRIYKIKGTERYVLNFNEPEDNLQVAIGVPLDKFQFNFQWYDTEKERWLFVKSQDTVVYTGRNFLPFATWLHSEYQLESCETGEILTISHMTWDRRYAALENGQYKLYFPWQVTATRDMIYYLMKSVNQAGALLDNYNTSYWDVPIMYYPIMGAIPMSSRGITPYKVITRRNLDSLPDIKTDNEHYYLNTIRRVFNNGNYEKMPQTLLTLPEGFAIDKSGNTYPLHTQNFNVDGGEVPLFMYYIDSDKGDYIGCSEPKSGTIIKRLADDTSSQIVAKCDKEYLVTKNYEGRKILDTIPSTTLYDYTVVGYKEINLNGIKMVDEVDNCNTACNPVIINCGDTVQFMTEQEFADLYGLNKQGLPATPTMFCEGMKELYGKTGMVKSIVGKVITVDFGWDDLNEKFSHFRLTTDFLTTAKYGCERTAKNLQMPIKTFVEKIQDLDSLILLKYSGELICAKRLSDGQWFYPIPRGSMVRYRYRTDYELYENDIANLFIGVFAGTLGEAYPPVFNSKTKIYLSTDYLSDEDMLVKTNKYSENND